MATAATRRTGPCLAWPAGRASQRWRWSVRPSPSRSSSSSAAAEQRPPRAGDALPGEVWTYARPAVIPATCRGSHLATEARQFNARNRRRTSPADGAPTHSGILDDRETPTLEKTAAEPCLRRDPRRVLFAGGDPRQGARMSRGAGSAYRGTPLRSASHGATQRSAASEGRALWGVGARPGLDDASWHRRARPGLSGGAARQTAWSLPGFSRAIIPEREQRGSRTIMTVVHTHARARRRGQGTPCLYFVVLVNFAPLMTEMSTYSQSGNKLELGGLDWRGWVRAALRALALRGARGGVRGVTGSKGRW